MAPGPRPEYRSWSTTLRSALNLINIDEDGPGVNWDEYHTAVDDGVRDKVWDLRVEQALYGQLAPGALVHAPVTLWRPRQASVSLVEPAAVPRPLADPGVPFDPRGGIG